MAETPHTELLIGNKNLSSWSLRPWLALRHAGLAFEETLIRLDQPDTRASLRDRSPSGLVPVLRTGGLTIWDSLAIIEYVADRVPEAGLWPEAIEERALARSMACEMHSGFASLRANLPMAFAQTGLTHPQSADIDRDIARIITLWTDALARKTAAHGGPFLFGAFGAVDAMYAPVVSRFRSYGVAMPASAAAYSDAVWQFGLMQEWLAGAEAEIAAGW